MTCAIFSSRSSRDITKHIVGHIYRGQDIIIRCLLTLYIGAGSVSCLVGSFTLCCTNSRSLRGIIIRCLMTLYREADTSSSSERYDLVWSVAIKSVDIVDPTLPSLYKATVPASKPSHGKPGL